MLSGPVWTTDAPYLETKEKVSQFVSRGAIAVDMEYSALLRLAHLRNVSLASAFVISDTLGERWKPGFKDRLVKESLGFLVSEIVRFLSEPA